MPFSQDWLKYLSDPFAVLGVSVLAEDVRVSKRYRSVAKILRPDISVATDPETGELIERLFGRLVNPAYEKIRQEKGRAETLALMRLKVRQMVRDQSPAPQSELARELSRKSLQEADIFYEQAIANLSERQYQPLENFQNITQQLNELNLAYLKLKMGGENIFIGEKRTGITTNSVEVRNSQASSNSSNIRSQLDYADLHYKRAQEYMNKNAWPKAIAELKDALRMEPNKSNYHSLIGLAYMRQNITPSAAKPHFRRALQLNPDDQIAKHFAARFDIQHNSSTNGSSQKSEPKKPEPKKTESKKPDKQSKKGWFFGLFGRG
ncbi:J domain-containing protein [Phormidesmis sp. 146-33]